MSDLLEAIGITIGRRRQPGALRLTNTGDLVPVAPYELVERIRASINVLGPLLTRCGRVRLSMPGGDDFGARPIDMHVAGSRGDGRDVQVQPRRGRGHGRPSARRRRHVQFPERRRDGEHRHRRRVRRRRDDDRQRGARAGGRRPLRDARRDGRRHHRRRDVTPRRPRRPAGRRCARPTHRTVPDRIQAATYLAALGRGRWRADDP